MKWRKSVGAWRKPQMVDVTVQGLVHSEHEPGHTTSFHAARSSASVATSLSASYYTCQPPDAREHNRGTCNSAAPAYLLPIRFRLPTFGRSPPANFDSIIELLVQKWCGLASEEKEGPDAADVGGPSPMEGDNVGN